MDGATILTYETMLPAEVYTTLVTFWGTVVANEVTKICQINLFVCKKAV